MYEQETYTINITGHLILKVFNEMLTNIFLRLVIVFLVYMK